MRDSVTVHMAAPPERIWDLVSDVTKIGRYSPETFEAEWLDGATGPAVGARFRGHVKRTGRGQGRLGRGGRPPASRVVSPARDFDAMGQVKGVVVHELEFGRAGLVHSHGHAGLAEPRQLARRRPVIQEPPRQVGPKAPRPG